MIGNLPSRTAEIACLLRAAERDRPAAERIVDDPYAEWFLGPIGRALRAGLAATAGVGASVARWVPSVGTFVLARHRYVDERVQEGLCRGAEQLVLLGAGYESRALRFAAILAGRPVFEVDAPATSRRKRRLLDRHRHELPPVDLRHVEIDFRRDSLAEGLERAGFRRGRRCLFVWEGVSMYLSREAAQRTLTSLREISAPGSELVADFWYYADDPGFVASLYRLGASALELLGEPVTLSLHPEDAEGFLWRLGYRLRDLARARELERRYVPDGRRIPPGFYVVTAETLSRAEGPERVDPLGPEGTAGRAPA